jgi:hypothetical protein
MECNMRSLNTKLLLTALGIVTMFASPAFAQKLHHRVDPSGRGIYNMVAAPQGIYNMVLSPDDPAVTGGGSLGWNELNRTNDNGAN